MISKTQAVAVVAVVCCLGRDVFKGHETHLTEPSSTPQFYNIRRAQYGNEEVVFFARRMVFQKLSRGVIPRVGLLQY